MTITGSELKNFNKTLRVLLGG